MYYQKWFALLASNPAGLGAGNVHLRDERAHVLGHGIRKTYIYI